jgi:acetyltransferase-like isoleucine patch superfamily enzyme
MNIVKFLLRIIPSIVCKTRSIYYSSQIDEGNGKIVITNPFIRLKIRKGANSKLIINGQLKITPFIEGTSPIGIFLGANSTLNIEGDFTLGQGVRIMLNDSSLLNIGGKLVESDSGITSDTLIMVQKKIFIGKDFLCAWNVFISDSDWHNIKGQKTQQDVFIGNHVWIANNCNILKGTIIDDNCMVSSQSKLINKQFPKGVLIGGIPAKILRENISWTRDIPNQDS